MSIYRWLIIVIIGGHLIITLYMILCFANTTPKAENILRLVDESVFLR